MAAAAAAGASAGQARIQAPSGALHRAAVPVRHPKRIQPMAVIAHCSSLASTLSVPDRCSGCKSDSAMHFTSLVPPRCVDCEGEYPTRDARTWDVCSSLEQSGHQACEAAAGDAIAFLRDWLGPRILAGRLTEQQLRLLQSSPRVPPPMPGSLGAAAGVPFPVVSSQISAIAPVHLIRA
jgi:hypothetical protein